MKRVNGILLLIAIVLVSLGMTYVCYGDDYMWQVEAIAYSHGTDFVTYMFTGRGYATFLLFATTCLFGCSIVYAMNRELKNESTASK